MLKTLAKIAVGLLALVLLAGVGLFLKAALGLSKIRDIAAPSIAVRTDSLTVERGRHLASAIMKCVECHGRDLGGTKPFADAGPLGYINGSNLTTGEGGVIGSYDDATIARAVRHGIKADGSPILLMPVSEYVTVSNADLAAVIAYVRSVAPVNRGIPPSKIKPMGRLLYALGQFPVVEADFADHGAEPAPDREPVSTVEYGKYLATIGGCFGCHGPGLSGGKIPGAPPDWKPATNITPEGLKGWTEADFVTALRTGIRPNRTPIDTLMPWRLAGQMDSIEMGATWRFLQSVPPKPYGSR